MLTKTVRSAGINMAASIRTDFSLWFVFKPQSDGQKFGALRSEFVSVDGKSRCFIQPQRGNTVPALCVVVQLRANETFA